MDALVLAAGQVPMRGAPACTPVTCSATKQRAMFENELRARHMSQEHVSKLIAAVKEDAVEHPYWQNPIWRDGRLATISGLTGVPLTLALQSMDEVGRKMEIMSLPDVPAFPPAVAPSAWVPDILQSKDGVKHLASLLVDPAGNQGQQCEFLSLASLGGPRRGQGRGRGAKRWQGVWMHLPICMSIEVVLEEDGGFRRIEVQLDPVLYAPHELVEQGEPLSAHLASTCATASVLA